VHIIGDRPMRKQSCILITPKTDTTPLDAIPHYQWRQSVGFRFTGKAVEGRLQG